MHDIVTQRLNQFLVEKNITYKELSGMILMSETSLCRKLTGSRSLDLHTFHIYSSMLARCFFRVAS